MRQQTEQAIAEADVALFLIDARAGITPMDEYFADLLRRGQTPVILGANKCEGRAGRDGAYEAYSLGLGDPIPLSAEHGEGLDDLYYALKPFAPELDEDSEEDEVEGFDGDRPIQVAIVGRPNTGKSTLVNRLLGEDRLLTGPEAGVTRDSIEVAWSFEGQDFRLVDTAGLRRKAKITEQVEQMSAADTLNAIRLAEVVVLLLDADAVLDKQDLTIARHVIEEGRALVIGVNKWDVAASRQESLQKLRDKLETSLPQVKGIPYVTLSAKTGKGVQQLMRQVLGLHGLWNMRIPTAELNRWLAFMTQQHPPPLSKQKRRIKLRYATQAKSRPPTFLVFTSRPGDLPEAYSRYLVNGLRQDFGLDGVPIRLWYRKPNNPYVDEN